MTEKFVTMVKIAVPFDGEPHAMQTKAQNLASSAGVVKKALVGLVAAASVQRAEFGDKLQKVINAARASQEDKLQYEHELKLAVADVVKVIETNDEIDRKLYAQVDNAQAALHDSECVTPIPEPLYGEPVVNIESVQVDLPGENDMGAEAADEEGDDR